MQYCIYLRKSRADAEAEMRGEGETLARHEHTLLELAKKRKLNIINIYREIVSGDSIAARPQMQKLLQDIEQNMYDGVLVMEIERLARGDTIDQGVVAHAFKKTSTKIITPMKTYDPDNEFDEEYFEFSLFMSRREYKTIKRRMQAGRVASVKEGNFICSSAPYGYKKINPEPKVHTLEIVPEEAKIVQKIYNMYLSGKGPRAIATELNNLLIRPQKSLLWEKVSIRKILTNPVYAGKIQWRDKNTIIISNGLHEAIISPSMWNMTQERIKSRPLANLKPQTEMVNYYHNVLYCENCGHQMKYRPTGGGIMLCRYNQCRGKVVSSSIKKIDDMLMLSIDYRINELKHQIKSGNTQSLEDDGKKKKAEEIQSALNKLNKQMDRLHTLLETEVYTVETYLERSKAISIQKETLEQELKEIWSSIKPPQLSPLEAMFRLQFVSNNFRTATVEEKNDMLLSIIRKITYHKTLRMCRWKNDDDLSLKIEFL